MPIKTKQITSEVVMAIAHRNLSWLRTLHWLALVGQALTIAITVWILKIQLYLPGLLACLVFDAALTLFIYFRSKRLQAQQAHLCSGVLLVSYTLTLTLMLHWSGGVSNPFATFYLLHIALAAMMLPWRFTLSLAILTILAYASLFTGLQSLGFSPTPKVVIPAQLQFPGMLLAIGLTGASLAWFIDGLRRDLLQREVALRLSQERLAKEERFAGLATLAAGVAHELATPLGTIAIICRELEHNIQAQAHQEEWAEDAQLIRQEVERCRKIIDRLNADATNDLGVKNDIFTLQELAQSLLEEVSPKVRTRVQYTIAPDIAERSLEAPQRALLQALATLLKNAAEADHSLHPVQLAVKLWHEGSFEGVAFIIRDQGQGIAPDIMKRLGEPFLTTKPPGQGMGLGLYIVRLFAERLRGKLEFENPPTGGCEARLILPFSLPA